MQTPDTEQPSTLLLAPDEVSTALGTTAGVLRFRLYGFHFVPLRSKVAQSPGRSLRAWSMTRARKLCVLVGTRKAIAMAVRNATVAERFSGLEVRLKEK